MSNRPNYDKDDTGNQPKHVLQNPDIVAKYRKNLGNLITKNMKTTGGADIDWIIEHNDKFIILEIKEFHDDLFMLSKGQMITFEKICKLLGNCSCIFVAHDDIDFTDPSDSVWIFEMKTWLSDLKEKSLYSNSKNKYMVEKSLMTKIDVKILRDIIDAAWS